MKKIILSLICMVMLISFVSAWGANRVISGNNITVTIDETGGTGIFTLQETITGATVISYPGICGLSGNILTCDSDDSTKRVINYMTSGSGSVNGIIAGGYPSVEKNVTGNTLIGVSTPQIKINEFVSDPDGAIYEWIELYNPTLSAVDLTGWTIKDNTTSVADLTGKTINANGYLVLNKGTDFNFGLNDPGDVIVLKKGSDEVDKVAYGNWNDGNIADNAPVAYGGNSTGRYPNGIDTDVDNANFIVFTEPTKGSSNIIAGDTTPPIISNLSGIGLASNIGFISWNTDEQATTKVYYGKTIGLGNEFTSAGFSILHEAEIHALDAETLYYYKVESCDASGNCANSSIGNFTTLPASGSTEEDDLMVNYVRGKIIIDGNSANASIEYKIEVLNGANAGYILTGFVDANIPDSSPDLTGNGYFDTEDNIKFNTGDSFRVSVLNLGYSCFAEGTFENGGNGNFENQSSLVLLNCSHGNYPPAFLPIGNKTVNENQTLEFYVNATDADTNINDLIFDVMGLPSGASFNSLTRLFSWVPDFNQAGEYNLVFSVFDGVSTTYEDIVITVVNINRMPVINMQDSYTILAGSVGNATINATDPDRENLTYSITNEDAGKVDCEISGNMIYFTPADEWAGTSTCELTVSDGNLSSSKTLEINVLPVNHPPVLVMNIPFIEWQEGIVLNDYLNLSRYFRDMDSNLSYSVSGNNNINISINNNLVSFSAKSGWYGKEVVVFTATDGEYSVNSNSVNLTVIHVGVPPEFFPLDCETNLLEDISYNCTLNVNNTEATPLVFNITGKSNLSCNIAGNILFYKSYQDYNGQANCNIEVSNGYGKDSVSLEVDIAPVEDAPVLEHINDITVDEGTQIIISPVATDPDIGDILNYEINDSRFEKIPSLAGTVFKWQTNYTDAGIYYVNISVVDLTGLTASQIVKITVNEKNQLPVITQGISDIQVEEDSDWTFAGTLVAYDPDGSITGYSIVYKDTNKVDCQINSSGAVTIKPAANFFGVGSNSATCSVAAVDNQNGKSNVSFRINVTNLPDSPVINSYTPLNNPRILNTSSQLFTVSASDPDNDDPLNILWLFGGTNVSNSWSYLFSPHPTGSYNLTAVISDGMFNVSHDWNIFVGNLDEFTCSEINGDICTEHEYCSDSWLGVKDTERCCPVQCTPNLFEELDTCQIKNSDITITIKDPDDGDEFKPGESIEGKIKIKNNLDDDKDFDITLSLYDLTDNSEIDSIDDSISIDEDESEELDFNLTIPDDTETGNEYAIYANAKDEDNESLCSEEYIKINIKREKHDVIVESANFDKDSAICSQYVSADIKVKNLGTRDEDVYLVIENSQLGIKEKSDTFTLEKYEDKDESTQTISFKIPENAAEGAYHMKIKAVFNGEEDAIEKEFLIGNCSGGEVVSGGGVINLGEEEQQVLTLTNDKNQQKPSNFNLNKGLTISLCKAGDSSCQKYILIDIILGIFIIAIAILIIWVRLVMLRK